MSKGFGIDREVSMDYKQELQEILSNYEQLRKMVRQDSLEEISFKNQIEKINHLIYKKLPELLKSLELINKDEILAEFYAEYEEWKESAYYTSLIGKNIVALGGEFSEEKTEFLNALLGAEGRVPVADPFNTVPMYVVSGEEMVGKAINIFDAYVKMDWEAICNSGFMLKSVMKRKTVHNSVAFAHMFKNLLLETNEQKYKNLAFLNIPGYLYENTEIKFLGIDKTMANAQLNTADFVLWFFPINKYEILSDVEIELIQKVSPEIPIALICSAANDRTEEQRVHIKTKLEEQIRENHLNVDKIFFFDGRVPKGFDIFKIYGTLVGWNKLSYDEKKFAVRFKKFFDECFGAYSKVQRKIELEIMELTDVLISLKTNPEATVYMKFIERQKRHEKQGLEEAEKQLLQIQNVFFEYIKDISDKVGIYMPEADVREGLESEVKDSLQILKYYNRRHEIQIDMEMHDSIKENLQEIEPIFECELGGRKYRKMMENLLEQSSMPSLEEIQFETDFRNSFIKLNTDTEGKE